MSAKGHQFVSSNGIAATAAANDSIVRDVYIINGKLVNHFDGSQLAGKTIVRYTIKEEVSGGITTRTHHIDNKEPTAPTPQQEVKKVWLLNGKVVDEAAIKALNPENIKSVTVIRHDSKNFPKNLGNVPKGADCIIVETK